MASHVSNSIAVRAGTGTAVSVYPQIKPMNVIRYESGAVQQASVAASSAMQKMKLAMANLFKH